MFSSVKRKKNTLIELSTQLCLKLQYNQQADLHVNNASMMTFNSIQCLTLFSTFPHITNINFN
ncbi:hypothetical protein T12_11866 [Trichinella patagoniensis]|uniref:Uncharacterized protein n=1 Tax=Trichinella patagoniensis TaxID=990121 RepID=A0A0V1A6K7_9BILA|nr:hypothetical protein T12_11866 [Trichinella patagoniensis]